jgi:hypothetical protein
MWIGDTIYFVSDREYTLNLFAMSPQGGEARKLTGFDTFDVLWPSAGPDAIVFENGGQVWRYDVAGGKTERVPITVRADLPDTVPAWQKLAGQIESFDIAPHGERVVFGARGEIFTVPAKDGEPRNLSRTPSEREISVSWSPDGKQIAYLSDASGEYEIYVRAQDGSGSPRRVTRDGGIWRFQPAWSPDGKKLAYSDKLERVRIVDVATGATTDVDTSTRRTSPNTPGRRTAAGWSTTGATGATCARSGCTRSTSARACACRTEPPRTSAPRSIPTGAGCIPLESRLQPRLQRLRVQLPLHRRHAHLRRVPERGRARVQPAQERRGEHGRQGRRQEGQGGEGGRRRRRAGPHRRRRASRAASWRWPCRRATTRASRRTTRPCSSSPAPPRARRRSSATTSPSTRPRTCSARA